MFIAALVIIAKGGGGPKKQISISWQMDKQDVFGHKKQQSTDMCDDMDEP